MHLTFDVDLAADIIRSLSENYFITRDRLQFPHFRGSGASDRLRGFKLRLLKSLGDEIIVPVRC